MCKKFQAPVLLLLLTDSLCKAGKSEAKLDWKHIQGVSKSGYTIKVVSYMCKKFQAPVLFLLLTASLCKAGKREATLDWKNIEGVSKRGLHP